MTDKELIVRLIQQDLKHCQLLYGLSRIGLDETDKHHLQILDIVYDLMKVPDSIEFEWGAIYHIYMSQAALLKIKHTDAHLKPLAELCYNHLNMLICCEKNDLNPDRNPVQKA